MNKLTAALTLVASLALAGTAVADSAHRRPAAAPAPVIVHQPAPAMIAPAFRAPVAAARWDRLTTQAAKARRGAFTLQVAPRASYDQLRLIATGGLEITAVQLTYAGGRTELVKPARDGLVAIEVGRGKLTSISVRYASHGKAARGARIEVLAKADAPAAGHRR